MRIIQYNLIYYPKKELTSNKIFGIIEDKIYIFNLNTLETQLSLSTYDILQV